jgi:hypothetical protein
VHGKEFHSKAPTKKGARMKCVKKVVDYLMQSNDCKEISPTILLNVLNPDRVYSFISERHEYTTSLTVSDDTFYGTGKSHI